MPHPRPAHAYLHRSGDCAAALLGSVPLGVTDFSSIAPDADAYFDRSEYLVKLEKRGAFVRALRPKGFGKSLFLSSLALLHDCSTTESDFYAAFRVRLPSIDLGLTIRRAQAWRVR